MAPDPGQRLHHAGQADLWVVDPGESGAREIIKVFQGTGDYVRELATGFGVNHPNVLRCLGPIRLADGKTGLRYPFISGGSLRERLADGALPTHDILRILRDVLSGLDALHRAGFVHADVKPANLLQDDAGAWIIADFGSTVPVVRAREGVRVPGSPAYLAPERLYDSYDGRSDLYSLGILAYEVASGQLPFQGSPQEILAAHLGKPIDLHPVACSELRDWIAQVTQKKPSDRPSTANDALLLLDKLIYARTAPGAMPRAAAPASARAPSKLQLVTRETVGEAVLVGVLDTQPPVAVIDDGTFLNTLDLISGRAVARPLLHDGRFVTVEGEGILTVIHGDLVRYRPLHRPRLTPLARGLRHAKAAASSGDRFAFVDSRGLTIVAGEGGVADERPWPSYAVCPRLAWHGDDLWASTGPLGDVVSVLGPSGDRTIAVDGPIVALSPHHIAITLSIARRDHLSAWFLDDSARCAPLPSDTRMALPTPVGVLAVQEDGELWLIERTWQRQQRLGVIGSVDQAACSSNGRSLITRQAHTLSLWSLDA